MRAKVFYILFFLPFAAFCQCAPGNVSNLFMWLKADNNVFGSPISGWGDSSPNGRNLNTSGANAPTSVSAGLNYNPLIRFDGVNDYFNRPSGILPTSTLKDFYVYFVTRTNSIATDQYLYAENSGGTGSPRIAGIIPAANSLMYQDFGDNVNGRLWVNWPGIGNTSDYILWSLNTSTTISTPSGANKAIYKNGTLVSNSVAQTMVTGNNSTFYLGSMDGASGFFNGDLAELIVFNGIPSTVEQRKIHSYLAAKYGITLTQGTPQDYIASDGTTLMWTSAKAVNLYNNNIAVLGRDDNSCLNQKQSKGWGDILTIGLNTIAGTNALNTSSVSNFTFQSWGNDNGSLSLQNSDMPAGSGFVNRVVREWKIQETGTVAQTMIAFDLSTTSILGNNASDFGLLIDLDGDGDFTTGSVTSFTATSYVNNKVYFANVNFSDQQVFTIATRISGPGGIISGLKLWLKSDAGVYSNFAGTVPAAHGSAIKYWKDFSPILNNATSAGTVDPVFQSISGQINYNPTVLITSNISTYLNIDLNSIKNSDYTLFGTSLRNGINNENYFLGIQCFIIDKCLSLGYRVDNTITLDQFGDKIELGVTSWNNPYSPSILSGGLDQSSGLFVSEQRQGVYTYGIDNTKTTPLLTGSDQGVVGRGYNTTGFLGNISEIIVYNRKLSTIENQKINSYLAIKNGVTLSQSTPTNYISSTGNVIWNAVSAGVYKYDIAAIGRDDNSSLNQKQSIAFSTGDIVSIGIGTVAGSNSANPNTFSSDQSFVSWSNNHDVFTEQTTDLPAGSAYSSRISREWKVQTTGTVGSTQLSFDLSAMSIATATASNLSLIIDLDGDGDFTTGSLTSITANSLSSNILKFNNVNLPNGAVFTIARNLGVGPGGITSGLNLWLKANSGVYSDISGTIPAVDGVGIKYWKDFSSTLNNAISTGTIDPVFQSTGGQINYNPTVFFNNPPDQYFNISLNSIMNSDYTLFGSFLRNSTVPNNYFLGTQSSILDNGLHFGYRTDNVVTLAQYNDDVNQNVPSYNLPYSPAIIVGKLDQSSGKSIAEYRNNLYNSSSNTFTTPLTGNAQGVVGRGYTAEGFSGNLTEILVYNRALTALETQKITSYLAIKNGVTIDQSTPTDYISSQGNIIWNSGIAGAYKYDIAAIGRDDKSSLNQKQSIAFNTGDLVTIGLGTISGTNSANPNSFSSDLSFISWSNNHGALSEQTTEIPTISSITKRLGREWKVQKVGTVGSVQVNVDLTSCTFSGTSFADFSLLVDSDGDGDFTTGTIGIYPATSLSGNILSFSNINFSNGDYFTISTFHQNPGGISGTFLWLKANKGVSGTSTVTAWADQSGNSKDLTNGINSNPLLNSSIINFNPSVYFNGINDYMTRSNGILGTALYPEFNTYIVSKTLTTTSTQILLFEVTNNAGGTPKYSIQLPTNTNLLQNDVGNGQSAGGGRLSTNWGANTTGFFLWSLNSSIGTSTPSGAQKANYLNASLLGSNSNAFSMRGNNSPFYLGSFAATSSSFNGMISEIIMVNKTVSGFDQKKIESYLAIKYGITLSQTTPTNYIASNGSVIWDASAAGTYTANIAGIGRDDASDLLQKQSQSNGSNELVTIGLGTISGSNALNTNSISSDLSFLVWSNNNGSNAEQTIETPSSIGILKRIGKEWKVYKTGSFGSLQVNVDLSTLTVSGTNYDDFNLLIDNDGDGDFTTGTIQTLPASTLTGNVVTFSNVSFNNGDIFTISTFKSAPGGVRSGLNLWLKANSGVFSNSSGTVAAINGSGVQYWYDFSLNQNHAIKGGASDPVYRLSTNLINYNPTVLFNNSTNQYFSVNFSSLMNNNYTLFGALMRSSNNSENYFLGTQSNTPNQALHIGYRNDTDVTLDQYSNNVDQAVTSYSSPMSPAILIGTSDLSSGKTISEYRNSGLATMNSANIQALTGTAPGVVGRGYGTNGFLGDLTEVMAYNRKLSSLEIQKVNSYLSIKNGISISQSTPTNYIASNGTTIWSAAIAGTYNNDIAGIGRDDASGLNQKQSKSVNSDEIISIGLGTIASSNMGNANSFGSDLTFQIWANDNGALLEQTTEIPTTTGCLKRLGREWKVKQTGTVGNCQLNLDLSSLTVTGSSLNDFNLFIDQDGDGNFTTGAITVIGASTLIGNVVTFNNVNFNDGNVFTFTTSSVSSISMGGIITSPSLLQCISGNSGTLTLTGYNGSILNWESSTDNFTTTQTITNTAFTNAFNNLTANTSFRARVQNSVCPSTTSGIITLTTVGISVGGSVSGINSPYCTGSNTGTLTLSGYVGNILLWQSSANNFSTVSTISNTAFNQSFNNLTTSTGYRAVIQNSVCPSTTSGIFTVSVVGISVGGTISGANISQCSGANSGTLTLSGFNGNIQKWQSSSDNFASISDIASTTAFVGFNNLTTTTSYRAIIQNGLCSTVSSSAFTITVNGISVGGTVAGTNLPVCASSNAGTLTLSGYVGTIQKWQSSTDNFNSVTNISSITSTIGYSNLTTTTSFRAIVQNGQCSTVSSLAFTITVNGVSIGGTVTGPNLSQCSGANSGTLTLSGFAGSIQNWQTSTDNFATVASISSITSFIAYSNLTTTTSFRSIVQNGACSTVSSGAFTITVNGISVGGTITGPNTPVCASSNLGTLTLAGFAGSIINWQSSSDNFATVTTISSTTSSIGFSNLSTTSSFKAIVQNGACATVSSNAFTLTVNGVSIGGTVSGSSIVQCAGANSGTITLTGFTGNIQGWQSSSDNFSTLTTIGSTTSTFSYSNLTTTTSFRAIVQNGACSTVSSAAFTITINGLSLGGSVSGTNISQCAGSNSGTLTLSGFSGNIQNWQSSTDNFATISSISSTAAFLGFANLTTTTSYRAIIQNGACSTVASSSFTVTVNGVSIGGSISGPTLPVCSGGNNGTLTLSGFSGNIINWQTSTDNFTTITNVSSITSSFAFLNISTSTSYRAIVQNGLCATISSSTFTITVNGISTGGTVSGNNVPYCASLNSGLLTVSGFIGLVQYWQSSTDNFATLTNISSVTSTFGFNNLSTTTSFRAIVQNGSCSTVASTSFTVTINGLSIGGNAVGPSSSQCLGSNSGTVSISGLVGNVLAWETSIDNFATTSPIASTTSFINFSNLTTSTGYRATVRNGVCSSTTSTAFTVTVGGVSVGGSINGPSASLCTGSNGILTLTGFIGNVLGWQSSTDNFASIIAISSTTSTLPFVNLTTTTSYRALVQNGACASSTSASFTVSVNGISVGGSVVGPSSPVCSSANSGTLTLSGYAGSILTWQSSTDNFTTFSPIASNSSFLIFSNLITTTSFRAIIQNGGCSSVTSSAFTITVNGLSVGGSISGPISSYCSGSNSGTITLSGFVGSILNWESSSDNFTTVSPISSTATSISFLNLTTTTSYRTVVQNGVCSTTNSASFTITVGGISVGGTIDGPTNLQCSGSNSGTLTLSGFSGNIISWESSTDNFATASIIASTNATLNYSNITTNTGFRAIIQNGACSTTTSASFEVSVSGVSIGGTITGPITPQCANANLFNLTLSGFIGSILNWESSTDNFSTAVAITSTTSNISLSNLLTNTSFRAIVQNGACSTTASSIFVASIDGIAIGGNVSGSTGILCAGSNLGDLTVTGFYGSIINWESSTDNFLTSNFIASTTSTFTFTNLVSTTGFRANIQNGSCSAISSSPYTVTISGISVGGSIDGPVSSQCSGSNLGDLTLTGFNGSIVNWESSTDNFLTSSVIASASPTITFTNLSTTTSYRANVQSGTCAPVSSSSFTISVNGAAFGGAISGPNTILCGSVNSGTLTLSGYAGTISNWESSTDNFNTTQPISNTTQYLTFNNLTTTTSFRATISNGLCPTLSSGLFTITISSPSFGGSIFASTNTVCSATNSGTISISGYVGSILNWESSLDNFTSSTTVSNTSDFYSFSNLTTTTSFRAIVQSGSCTSTISGITTVLVVPNSASGTIAGPASSFCSGSNSGTLTLSGFVGSILNWQSSIDNFASSTIINQTSSTLGFNNLSQSTSFRAIVQNGNCSASISTPFAISLSSGSAGTVSGPLSPLCITNANGTLTLSGFTAPVNRWEYTIDNSTFIPIPNSSASYSFTQLTTTTSFRAIVQSGSCPEVSSSSFTVTVSPLPKSGTITGGTLLPLGENAGTIQLTNYYGQIIAWEEASDSLMTNPSIINNTSSQQNYTNLTSTKYYRATVSTPGCQAIKSNSAGIVIQLLIIYTGFSPDGDGKNDTWVIENIQLYPNNQVKIYNRWGNLVYQESGYDNSTKVWKGNSNTGFVIGGDALPEGTYYYIISINGKSDLSGYLLLNK